MFQGNTHYKDTVGFVKDRKDNEFDLFLEYVNMIDRRDPERGKEGQNFPHPKWLEFWRRVDQLSLLKPHELQTSVVPKEVSTITMVLVLLQSRIINKTNQQVHTKQH